MSRAPSEDRKSTRLNSSHTVIYTLSLHDALPIFYISSLCRSTVRALMVSGAVLLALGELGLYVAGAFGRSEEHTSELQSHSDLHSFPTRRSSDLLHLFTLPKYGPRFNGLGCGVACPRRARAVCRGRLRRRGPVCGRPHGVHPDAVVRARESSFGGAPPRTRGFAAAVDGGRPCARRHRRSIDLVGEPIRPRASSVPHQGSRSTR